MPASMTRFDSPGNAWGADPFHTFDNFFPGLRAPSPMRNAELVPRIRMDVTETEHIYKVKADMPGAKKEDIKVSIDGSHVSISVDTTSQTVHEGATLICAERSWGQFYRTFTLPQAVDEALARAAFRDGVLELELPKKPGGKGTPLTIA